jgi:hypothetical protein
MAEYLNQTVEPEMSPLSRMGKPLGERARSAAHEHCKQMGLNSGACVGVRRHGRGATGAGQALRGTGSRDEVPRPDGDVSPVSLSC